MTHLLPDHASGYFRIIEQYPQTKTLHNCYLVKAGRTSDIVRWVDAALKANPYHHCVKRGDKIMWQDTEIEVLWPICPLKSEAGLKHSSLLLQLSRSVKRLLIMGDADKKAEAKMLEIDTFQPIDILVVGHHGCRRSKQ